MCHVRWSEFSPCVLCCGRIVQLCRTKQHTQCATVQEQWQEIPSVGRVHALNALTGTCLAPKAMTGDSPPSKVQLDVVLLSALHIRGRCLEHLPKSALGLVPGSFSAELEFPSELSSCSARKKDL